MSKHWWYGGLAAAMVALPAAAQPANDGCGGAIAVTGLGTFPFTTVGATSGVPAGSGCVNVSVGPVYNDVWFSWVANFTGAVRFRTCGGTALDTKIALYQAATCPPGTPLDCSDDACSTQSELVFNAVAGTSYIFRIGAFQPGLTGSGTFSLSSGVIAGPITNPANGHRYWLLGPDSYTNARQRAIELGGKLATINNAAENEWVRANVVGIGGVTRNAWIGYTDAAQEGTWVWESGETPGYTNWLAPNPNNFNGLEHFAEMSSVDGRWSDRRDLPGGLLIYGVVELPEPACVADFNNLNGVTVQDIYDFLAAVLAQSIAADVNNSGTVTVQDIYDFLELWNAGCP